MKKAYTLMAVLLASVQFNFAQINLDCEGAHMNSIFLVGSFGIYRIDSVNTNPTSLVFLTQNTPGAIGISINNNFNNPGTLTMYACNSLTYSYWDGTSWVNTGHSMGSFSAVNPGGGNDYIFNINDDGLGLYRYDGVSSTLLLTNLGTPSDFIHDVAVDNQGNFYIFYTIAQQIIMYTSNGIPVDTFSTSGFPQGSECGLAIIGDRVYATTCSGAYELYEGIKTGNMINFTMVLNFISQSSDIAACPGSGMPLSDFKNHEMPRFSAYPNPAMDFLNISLINTSNVQIFDCLGRKTVTAQTEGLSKMKIDVRDWTPGVYLIKAISENNAVNHGKLIVK